jgi:tetratricopeptide (TPR) repeat protein
MMIKNRMPLLWLSLAVSSMAVAPGVSAVAQSAARSDNNAPPAATPGSSAPAVIPGRATAYYHAALADMYEEQAINSGRPEFVQHAIEEYKAAINADPASADLYDSLAELYFRTGRSHEAESTARQVLKDHPDNIDAHRLLGRMYLRQLGEQENSASSSSAPSGNTLDQAIAEFEKIVALQPKSVEDHMVLGQLYSVKHQVAKAEQQFKIAQDMDPDSEEVILNLARVYAENGDLAHAAKVIEAVPDADRSARMEFTLGATYEQLKRPKDAIAAYQRAADLQPDDVPTMNALGQALLNDNQLDAAMKVYKLADADSEDADPLIKLSEIERRQQKYDDALATIRKARKKNPESLEAGYNEGLLLDVLGHYDEAAATYSAMVDQTSHANGAYTTEEKNNRGIFLERLGAVYHEQNKVDQAIATYQKMIEMGGDPAKRAYQFQVDTYNDARMFDKAIEVSKQAIAANPNDLDMKLMLAGELVNQGKVDEGLNMTKALLNNTDQDRTVYFALGNMYTRLRRWKDADDALAKATPLATKKDDQLYLLFLKGALADRQKHMDQAETDFRQALDVDPNNAMILNYLGYMFADKGVRLPEALKLIHKAVDLEPMNGAYLDSLGWAYFKLGEYELAEENLRQAVERDQTDPTVHDHLGDLYEKTGRIRQAAAQWELSIAEFQKTPAVDVEPGDMNKVQHKLESARVKLAKQDSMAGDTSKPE